jgi:hypothetical protein
LNFVMIYSPFPVDEKLQWLFKLYDKDSNGEIVQEELEDIFLKMCRIVEKTEVDHCSAVQCSAVQCSAVQCSAVRCSAVQCSAVKYSAV